MSHFIFDRSNLDEIVAITMDGKSISRRESLAEPNNYYPRRDIVLWNEPQECTCYCGDKHHSNKQYSIEVTMSGFSGDFLYLWGKLSSEEKLMVEQIAARMRQNARKFPPAMKLIAKE